MITIGLNCYLRPQTAEGFKSESYASVVARKVAGPALDILLAMTLVSTLKLAGRAQKYGDAFVAFIFLTAQLETMLLAVILYSGVAEKMESI